MTNAGWKEALIREVTANTVRLSEVIERLEQHELRHSAAEAATKNHRISVLIALGSALVAVAIALFRHG